MNSGGNMDCTGISDLNCATENLVAFVIITKFIVTDYFLNTQYTQSKNAIVICSVYNST